MSGRSLTVQEIAALTGAELSTAWTGDQKGRIDKVSSIAAAEAASLVFAEEESSFAAALASRAGAILVSSKLPAVEDGRVLRAKGARYAFALCARELGRPEEITNDPQVHPAAVVHPTARLGLRVQVDAGAVIEQNAVLGDDVVVGNRAVVCEGVVLGDRVVVQPGAVLGSKGFGYVRHVETGEYLLFPQQGTLVIEEDVEIGANTTIDRGALEETRIGAGTKIDNLVHIGHNCQVGRNVVIAAQVGVSGSCVIEDGAVLAGQVGISDHCHIGPGVILGGQAGVYRGKTVAGPGEVFSGTPAEPLREHMKSLARLRRLR